ncbi:hypothetical protein Q9R19_12040 [Microbacterium sp. ARD32]|uniref:hypothetical protein n=1 Tax=Microbacterium sp. ARD32 TaxID=2962577 RepID=UPI0028828987|nr:hypothetical protein [Microbacterium sp. ARD32]MDT0158360.1 hypothetical protein [Microbacterium sp. ARD32]
MRRGLIGGGVLAALWLLSGWLSFWMLRAGGSIATLGELVPSPMARGVFGSPLGWAMLVQALTVVAVATGFAALCSWFAPRAADVRGGMDLGRARRFRRRGSP